MENQNQESNKVVSLFGNRKPQTEGSAAVSEAKKEDDLPPSTFLDEIRRNAENIERLRKDRLKANQGVLKSYRIKN